MRACAGSVFHIFGFLLAIGYACCAEQIKDVAQVFSAVNGVLNLVLVASSFDAPHDVSINNTTKVQVYRACQRLSHDQMDCPAKKDAHHPFMGTRLHLSPGDVLKIRLVNRLPATPELGGTRTNLHFHGLIVSTAQTQSTFGDYAFVTCYNSLEESNVDLNLPSPMILQRDYIDYKFEIPVGHPQGLFWFHPHNHALSAMASSGNEGQINSGLSGIIQIGRVQDSFANTGRRVGEKHMLLRTTMVESNGRPMVLPDPLFCNPEDEVENGFCKGTPELNFQGGKVFFTINGQVFPSITIPARNGQIWRITQSMASVTLDLRLVDDETGKFIPFQVLAIDGVSLGPHDTLNNAKQCGNNRKVCVDSLFVMPSSRVDVFVSSRAKDTRATLLGVGPQMGYGGDLWPSVKLATVSFVGGRTVSKLVPTLKIQPELELKHLLEKQPQKNLPCTGAPLAPGHRRRIYFGVDADDNFAMAYAEIDAKGRIVANTQTEMSRFAHETIIVCAKLGSVEIWELENVSEEDHNFHIHQTKFRVLETDEIEPGYVFSKLLVDSVPLIPQGKTIVEIPFLVSGDYLYHCHIAEHSDNGMMARIRVTTTFLHSA